METIDSSGAAEGTAAVKGSGTLGTLFTLCSPPGFVREGASVRKLASLSENDCPKTLTRTKPEPPQSADNTLRLFRQQKFNLADFDYCFAVRPDQSGKSRGSIPS